MARLPAAVFILASLMLIASTLATPSPVLLQKQDKYSPLEKARIQEKYNMIDASVSRRRYRRTPVPIPTGAPTPVATQAPTASPTPTIVDYEDLEEDIDVPVPEEEYEAFAAAEQGVSGIPSGNPLQDDFAPQQTCSLWTEYNPVQCISRDDFKEDVYVLARRLVRKGVDLQQATIYLDEYRLRLRNAWLAENPVCGVSKTIGHSEQIDRAKCLVDEDAKLLGMLLAAIIEELPASATGFLRPNPLNQPKDSMQCCHQACSVVQKLNTNTDLIHDTCCLYAPSKCANFY